MQTLIRLKDVFAMTTLQKNKPLDFTTISTTIIQRQITLNTIFVFGIHSMNNISSSTTKIPLIV